MDKLYSRYGIKLLNESVQQAAEPDLMNKLLPCVGLSEDAASRNPQVSGDESKSYELLMKHILQPVLSAVFPKLNEENSERLGYKEGQKVPFCLRRGVYLLMEACSICAEEGVKEEEARHYGSIIAQELEIVEEYVKYLGKEAVNGRAVLIIFEEWSKMLQTKGIPSLQLLALTEAKAPVTLPKGEVASLRCLTHKALNLPMRVPADLRIIEDWKKGYDKEPEEISGSHWALRVLEELKDQKAEETHTE